MEESNYVKKIVNAGQKMDRLQRTRQDNLPSMKLFIRVRSAFKAHATLSFFLLLMQRLLNSNTSTFYTDYCNPLDLNVGAKKYRERAPWPDHWLIECHTAMSTSSPFFRIDVSISGSLWTNAGKKKNEMAYAALEGTQNSTYELAFSSSSAGVLPRCQVDAHFRNQLKTSSGNPSAVGTSVDFSGPCLHYLGHNKSHFFIYWHYSAFTFAERRQNLLVHSTCRTRWRWWWWAGRRPLQTRVRSLPSTVVGRTSSYPAHHTPTPPVPQFPTVGNTTIRTLKWYWNETVFQNCFETVLF